jgi:protease-4
MKDFGKIVLASAVGFLIAQIILFIISIILFFSTMGTIMSSTSGEKFTLKSNSVLHLKLAGSIVERTSESDPFTEIMSSKYDAPMGLNDIVSAIRKAKSNDNIKGIYIDSRVFAASPATLAEIRNELKSFKESGKFIVSYSDMYTQAGYYIASVADKVAINPKGTLDIHGMASSPFFYKDALDKLGIDVQVFKVGTYKSAVEPYIQNEMSEANREQISSYLNDIWSEFRKDFAESRSMTTDEVDRLADEVPAMKQTDFLLFC